MIGEHFHYRSKHNLNHSDESFQLQGKIYLNAL